MTASKSNSPNDWKAPRFLPEKELLKQAEEILLFDPRPQAHIYNLAMALKNRYKRFGMARQLLGLIRSGSERVIERRNDEKTTLKLAQQHALCTYKDPDQPDTKRFRAALNILQKAGMGDLKNPKALISQETLGIAGAIYKAQWETLGQRSYLYRSLACYRRAWKQGLEADGVTWKQRVETKADGKEVLTPGDDAYNGINTAYLLDLIAFQEEREAEEMGAMSNAPELREEGRQIRASIVHNLPTNSRLREALTS